MALADKSVVVYGLNGAVESTYGTAITATTAIQMAGLPDLTPGFAYDGERPQPPGSTGRSRTAPVSGKTGAMTVQVEGKGAGTTYTTAVFVPSIHNLLLASGFDASLAGGAYTFSPSPLPTGYDSLSLDCFTRGEKFPLSGVYADMAIVFENAAPALFEFSVQGILGTETDAAVPSITYDALTVLPPNMDGLTVTINSVTTLIVRSGRFEMGWASDNPRVDLNAATGHAGFSRGRRDPRLRLTVENPDSSELNVRSLRDAGTVFAAAMTMGSGSYNNWVLTLAQSTMRFAYNDDDPLSLIDLEIVPHVSTPIANDDVSLVFGA